MSYEFAYEQHYPEFKDNNMPNATENITQRILDAIYAKTNISENELDNCVDVVQAELDQLETLIAEVYKKIGFMMAMLDNSPDLNAERHLISEWAHRIEETNVLLDKLSAKAEEINRMIHSEMRGVGV